MDKVILPKQKAITIFLVFALGYYISNLLRAITATISPNLVSEFNLSAGDLGLLGGGYFLGFASVQIPIGYLLDKSGPKKIVSYFLLIAILGMISFSLSENFTSLLISRILIGIGVGACLMGPLTAYRVWFQDETQQRANSWMLMTGAIGMLSSSLPVQYLLPIIGWRSIFLFLAILTLISILLIIIFIPNSPSSFAARKVSSGFDFVSLGIISIDELPILLTASRVDLIIDWPISEFLPVNGTSKPIKIFSLAMTFFSETEKVKAKSNIILIIFFILMLLL